MVKDIKLYDVLEVDSTASETEIKKSYNRLSKLWHPDKHIDPVEKEKAHVKFQEINNAKEILLDSEKRQLYDQIGMDIFNNGGEQQMHNPFEGFGSMFGHQFSRRNQPENIVDKLNVTLEQIYKEEEIPFTYKQKISCVKCNGKMTTCGICKGSGMKIQLMRSGNMMQQSVGPCNNCNSTGTVMSDKDKCTTCNGKFFTVKEKTISIPLNACLTNGTQVQLEGKGHQLKSGKTDLILVINEIPHKLFLRNDKNLFMTIELKIYQALFGFDKIITHLDNRQLHISSSDKTDYNSIRKIPNEGMDKKGDLYIKFIINIPDLTQLPQATKQQLKTLFQSFDKQEVQNELNILNQSDLIKTKMNNCSADQSNGIFNLMTKIKEKNEQPQEDDEREQHQHRGQPQCAQS